jgi:hypothetical protein
MLEKGLSLFEKALTIIEKYQIKHVFKAVFLIIIVVATFNFVKNPTYFFEKYKEWETEKHTEALEKRMSNSTKIQLVCEKILYKVHAHRVVVLELHNGLTSNGNLPFAKCTATYEALNDGAIPVSQQYQNTNLSLMPFADVLFKEKYWCGNTKELEDIDRGLYYKFMSNRTEHFACIVVEGINKALALMMVSFNDTIHQHSCENVKEEIRKSSLELALLMELREIQKDRI